MSRILFRNCKEIRSISDMKGKLVKKKDVKYYARKLKGVKEQVTKIKQAKQDELKEIEKDTIKAITDIAEFRALISTVLDRMEKKGKAHIETRQKELSKDIEHDIERCNKVIESIDKRLTRLKSSRKETDSSKAFVEIKKKKETMQKARQLLGSLRHKTRTGMVQFTVDPKVVTFARNLSWYGKDRTYLSFEQPLSFPHLYKVKNETQFDVRAKGDKGICNIVDVCQLGNGTLLLADASNGRLKQMDILYQLVDCLDLPAEPTSVATLDEGRAIVALKGAVNSVIQILDVRQRLKPCDSFIIPDRCDALACGGDELFLSSRGVVYVYSLKGELLQDIYTNDDEGSITSLAFNAEITKLYIMDSVRGLVTIATNGEELGSTSDDSLKGHCSVVVDKSGQILTSGQDTHVVSQFNHDLSCLGVLVTGSAGFRQPQALAFDRLNTRLIAASKTKNVLKVFHLK